MGRAAGCLAAGKAAGVSGDRRPKGDGRESTFIRCTPAPAPSGPVDPPGARAAAVGSPAPGGTRCPISAGCGPSCSARPSCRCCCFWYGGGCSGGGFSCCCCCCRPATCRCCCAGGCCPNPCLPKGCSCGGCCRCPDCEGGRSTDCAGRGSCAGCWAGGGRSCYDLRSVSCCCSCDYGFCCCCCAPVRRRPPACCPPSWGTAVGTSGVLGPPCVAGVGRLHVLCLRDVGAATSAAAHTGDPRPARGVGERATAAARAATPQGAAAGVLCEGGVPVPPRRGPGAPPAAAGSSRPSKTQQWGHTQSSSGSAAKPAQSTWQPVLHPSHMSMRWAAVHCRLPHISHAVLCLPWNCCG